MQNIHIIISYHTLPPPLNDATTVLYFILTGNLSPVAAVVKMTTTIIADTSTRDRQQLVGNNFIVSLGVDRVAPAEFHFRFRSVL